MRMIFCDPPEIIYWNTTNKNGMFALNLQFFLAVCCCGEYRYFATVML